MENLWGDFLDDIMAWYNYPQPAFCPCCGQLIIPAIFKRRR